MTLFVKEANGRYKPAPEEAILSTAAEVLHRDLKARTCINSPQMAKPFLAALIQEQKAEQFAVMFLDTRHRVIDTKVMFTGTINGASVYPREVARAVLEHNAAAVILAHNHPSGVAEPSNADRSITDRLKEALNLLECRILDHIVFGAGGENVSFAERGWL